MPTPFPIIRTIRIVAIAAVIAAVFSYLDIATHSMDYFEEQLYGDRLEVDGSVHPELTAQAASQIQVVSVTDDTYKWAAHGGPMQRYLPRQYYADLIDKLTSYGAKVIAFDILFDTSDAGDSQMTTAIRRSGKVLLACGDAGDENVNVTYPEDMFIRAGCRLGHSRVPLSVDSPAIDQIEPVVQTETGWLPALSVEAARMYRGIADLPLRAVATNATVPKFPIANQYSGTRPSFKIRFLYSPSGVFPQIPMERIIDANPESNLVYRSVFRDKIVLIGDTTKIGHDRYMTPLETMPGVLIQANATATLLDGHFIHEAAAPVEVLVLVLLVALTTILSTIWPLRSMALLIVLILPVSFLLNVWLFVQHDYYLHLAGPSGATILTALSVLLERGLVEESEKARMRELLLRYLNPRIADYILKHPELIGARGKRAYGTILFSDVRGFTSLAEELSPEDLVERMNEYFQEITEIVFRHDGTAASIVGDSMLALFGIPVSTPDHADQAVAAAIEIQAAGVAFQDKWRRAGSRIMETGIGINSGEVIVGEVGGRHLRNFTVYGLQVNIASRVEGLNRDQNTQVLITRSTYEALKTPVIVGPLVSVRLKGVGDPIDIFELRGY